MKDLDPLVLISVFLEMMGPLFWVLLAVGILAPLAFLWQIVRERGLAARRFLGSQALGLLGGVGALALMARVSSSGFTDAGGPIDWLLIVFIFFLGMVYSTMILYTLSGWLVRPQTRHS